MKINFMATLVAAFAAGFQTLAAISSLPIGSVEKVLNQYILNTDSIAVNVLAVENSNTGTFLFMDTFWSYIKADGTTESINTLCQRVATSDKTELRALLEKMLREAVRVSLDPNDPALQGKVIVPSVTGIWQPDPKNYAQSAGTFFTFSGNNKFVLGALKDSQGKTIIPENAYLTDIDTAVAVAERQELFIGNVASGEVRDGLGNIVDEVIAPSWATNTIILNNEVLSGQPGTVELRYTDGTSQVFNLADGSLLSPTIKIEPVTTTSSGISAKNAISSGPVRITVTGPPGLLTVEYSENLKDWEVLTVLTNSIYGSVSTVDEAASARGVRFYRARVW